MFLAGTHKLSDQGAGQLTSSTQLTFWRTPGRSLRILGKTLWAGPSRGRRLGWAVCGGQIFAPPSVHLSWVKLDGKSQGRPNEFCTMITLKVEHVVQWQMQSWWRFDYKWNWQCHVYVTLTPLEHSPRLGNENKFEKTPVIVKNSNGLIVI